MAHFLPKLAFLVAATAIGSAAFAASTEDDANKLLGKAQEYIKANGWEKSVIEFNKLDSPFNSKSDMNPHGDLYLFSFNFSGLQDIHGKNPKIRGQTTIGLKDQNGVMIIQTMVDKCKKEGKGTVDYIWPNAVTKALDKKRGIVQRVPGMEQCVGTGINPK